MDNHYTQLSAGESIYYQGGMPAVDALLANGPSATIATSSAPVKLRKAGRKPLDENGKRVSSMKGALNLQRKLNAREVRKAARAAETIRKKAGIIAHQERKAEAAKLREQDIARANKASVSELPPLPATLVSYQVLYTSQNGTRHVKVANNTILEIPAGKSIDEAVSRFSNRKRVIF